jgi:hypothetical protein
LSLAVQTCIDGAGSAISKSGIRFCVRSRSKLLKERMILSPNRSHVGGSGASSAFRASDEAVSLGKGHPFLHVARANRVVRGESRLTMKG